MEESAGCSNDYVIIRDGLLKNSPVLQRICGKSVPTTIESSSHQVSIQFITNSKEEAAGFIINYEKTSASKNSNQTVLRENLFICCDKVLRRLILLCYEGKIPNLQQHKSNGWI